MALIGFLGKITWDNRAFLLLTATMIYWSFGSFKHFFVLIIWPSSEPWYTEETKANLAWWGTVVTGQYSALWLMWKLFQSYMLEIHGPGEVPLLVDIVKLLPSGFVRSGYDSFSHSRGGYEWTGTAVLSMLTTLTSVFGLIKFGGYTGSLIALQMPLVFDFGLVSLITQVRAAFGEISLKDDSKLTYRNNPTWAWVALGQAAAACAVALMPFKDLILVGLLFTVLPLSLTGTILLNLIYGREPEYLASSLPISTTQGQLPFCQICESTVLADLRAHPRGERSVKKHHLNVKSLHNSALSGCRICATVWQWRTRTPGDFRGIVQYWLPATTYKINVDSFHVTSAENRIPSKFDCRFSLLQRAAFHRRLDLFPEPVSSLTNNTRSSQSLLAASQWLNLCLREHRLCGTGSLGAFAPSRLLYIEDFIRTGNIYLQSKASNHYDESTHYVTLSHCWGKIRMKKLLKHNINTFHQGIAGTSLPVTFYDAIVVAVILRQKYIWIDSLCIVQDDVEDWKREAPMMGNVYRNSLCNIAASDSPNSSEGCLNPRNPRTLQPEVVRVATWDGTEVQRVLVNESDIYNEHVLYTRAWVLQEAILAPRVLDCGRGQLFWRCAEFRASEVFKGGIPNGPEHQDHPATKFSTTRVDGTPCMMDAQIIRERLRSHSIRQLGRDRILVVQGQTAVERNAASHFALWAQMVERFTEMNLSVSSDRMVALSGIIDLFRPYLAETEQDHLTGLWKCYMPLELLWSRNGITTRRRRSNVSTWSWQSVDFPVSYWDCSFDPNQGPSNKYGGDILLATFLNSTQIIYEAGQKDVTELKLRARPIRATWIGYWKSHDDSHPIGTVEGHKEWLKIYGVSTIPNYTFGTIRFDEPYGDEPSRDIWLLPVQIHHWYGNVKVLGLVMDMVSTDKFVRIGRFEGPNERLAPITAESLEREITLV